jgi:O-antigen/teichoic acid export membrane protein
VLQITNQLNDVLFPVVVDCDSTQRDDRLREVLVQGTKICLALAVPVAGAMALLAEQVVLGWIGPQFVDAAVLVQILAAVVVVRVATATAATVLRGAGHIRLLAWSTSATAVVNIVLSIILLHLFGLPGVAIASLIPIAARAVLIVLPVACRRVGMSLQTFVVQAVWPCVWPGVVSLGLLAAVREHVAPSLIECVLYGLGAWVIYAVLFVGVALGSDERRRYVTRLRGLRRVPALEAA